MAYGDGSVSLRWIDERGAEEVLVRIGARTNPQPDSALRVDPHPAWDKTWRLVTFNGVIPGENTRRVFVADLSEFLNS